MITLTFRTIFLNTSQKWPISPQNGPLHGTMANSLLGGLYVITKESAHLWIACK